VTEFRGVPVSPGVALARLLLWPRKGEQQPAAGGEERSPEAEEARFRQAVESILHELHEERADLERRAGAETAAILEAHALIAADPELEGEVLRLIREEGLPAAQAILNAGNVMAELLGSLDDPYLSQRADDVRDVASRLAGAASGEVDRLPPIPWEHAIVVAEDLPPSRVARLDPARVAGLVCERGGATSHAAFIARSLGIPAVFATGRLPLSDGGYQAVLDGTEGRLIVEPEPAVVEQYRQRMAEEAARTVALEALRLLPGETRDGRRRVELAVNIGHPSEAEAALRAGAEGVGLFRTEFLFLDRRTPPSEQEQYEAYRSVLTAFGERPVIIRTLDIGGDKQVPYLNLPPEENPFLGWRGIRLWASREDLWRPQLRALLRAAPAGNLHIMLPMVASPDEVEAARGLLEEARRELAEQGTETGPYRLGIMIEVPAAVAVADQLAEAVDFFSIGTNDLTQYTLAVDRNNPRVTGLYRPLSPAVLRMVEQTVRAAHQAGIWCGMCGELAGSPAAAAVLIGLGLDELSMAAPALPPMKEAIRNLTLAQAEAAAAAALLRRKQA
jgi:phosphoenolpyruvate-protein phosphotransferase (PTS system enzyme I)